MLAQAVHSTDAVRWLQPQSVGVVPKQNSHMKIPAGHTSHVVHGVFALAAV
eukprot:m.123896 g.123896  ORF g.123896 m.123896 type:complete len:51 (-) comp22040_c0_seq4:878-1030(-)